MSDEALVSRDPAAAQADYLRQFEADDKSSLEARDGAVGVPAYVSYVWFKTTNEDLKEELKAKGAQLPSFVLTRAGFKQPIKPFKFHLFDSKTIATKNDTTGKIVDAEARLPQFGTSKEDKEEARTWAEHTFAVVGVIDGDFITPAFVNLRSGARRALSYAITATNDARDNRWGGKGAGFAAAVAATKLAPGRVVSVASITPEKNSQSGHWQLIGKSSWNPAAKEDLERFLANTQRPQFYLDLQATARVYAAKLKGLLSKEMDAAQDE